MVDKVIIEGWGSLDLLKIVKRASWVPSNPCGRNFMGLSLAGNVLNSTPDDLAPVRYRVTVEAVEKGEKFIVDGHCFPDLLMEMMGYLPIAFSVSFAGQKLIQKPNKETRFYRVTIETVK